MYVILFFHKTIFFLNNAEKTKYFCCFQLQPFMVYTKRFTRKVNFRIFSLVSLMEKGKQINFSCQNSTVEHCYFIEFFSNIQIMKIVSKDKTLE